MGLRFPLINKFMINSVSSTTSTTALTLGTYTSSNGIGIVLSNVTNNTANESSTLFLYNGTTQLAGINGISAIANQYNHFSFAYSSQGSVTLSLEGNVSGGTGNYDVTIYEVF